MEAHGYGESSRLGALDFMARRTAGRIVRNAASLGGNSMLVLHHIAMGTGEPFPSDLMTALAAAGASVSLLELEPSGSFTPHTMSIDALVAAVHADPSYAGRIVLTSYDLPYGDGQDVVLAQKVALREVNAHSIVNATTRFTLGGRRVVKEAAIVLGGIAPYPGARGRPRPR